MRVTFNTLAIQWFYNDLNRISLTSPSVRVNIYFRRQFHQLGDSGDGLILHGFAKWEGWKECGSKPYEAIEKENGRYLGLELPMRLSENHERALWWGKDRVRRASELSISCFGDITFDQYSCVGVRSNEAEVELKAIRSEVATEVRSIILSVLSMWTLTSLKMWKNFRTR